MRPSPFQPIKRLGKAPSMLDEVVLLDEEHAEGEEEVVVVHEAEEVARVALGEDLRRRWR